MGVRPNSLRLTSSSADSDLSVLKLAADCNHLGTILTTDARAPPPMMLDLIVLGCGLSTKSSELMQWSLSTTGLHYTHCHSLYNPFLTPFYVPYVLFPQRNLKNKTASFISYHIVVRWYAKCLPGLGDRWPWLLFRTPALTCCVVVSRLSHFLMAQFSHLKSINQNACYLLTMCQPLLKAVYIQLEV